MTRSLIGQQPTLNTQPDAEPTLLPTTVPPDRTRGPNQVAQNVNVVTNNVSETGAIDDSRTNNNRETIGSPRRRAATNDGQSTRPRRNNVDFGLSIDPFLSTSTGQWQLFDINRM